MMLAGRISQREPKESNVARRHAGACLSLTGSRDSRLAGSSKSKKPRATMDELRLKALLGGDGLKSQFASNDPLTKRRAREKGAFLAKKVVILLQLGSICLSALSAGGQESRASNWATLEEASARLEGQTGEFS